MPRELPVIRATGGPSAAVELPDAADARGVPPDDAEVTENLLAEKRCTSGSYGRGLQAGTCCHTL
jgi:hypothetical protein